MDNNVNIFAHVSHAIHEYDAETVTTIFDTHNNIPKTACDHWLRMCDQDEKHLINGKSLNAKVCISIMVGSAICCNIAKQLYTHDDTNNNINPIDYIFYTTLGSTACNFLLHDFFNWKNITRLEHIQEKIAAYKRT
jgi:hypothetical protein